MVYIDKEEEDEEKKRKIIEEANMSFLQLVSFVVDM